MSTLVYNTGEFEKKQEEKALYFGLFFDGTLNSKNNTQLRLENLNRLEKGKKVSDYIIKPNDSPEVIAEKKAIFWQNKNQ